MAIVGYWANLAEAVKLVQDKLVIAGLIEEVIKEGHLLPKLPVFAIDAKSIVYNREKTLPTAEFVDIHEQLEWKTGVEYTQVSLELKRIVRQSILDHFIMKTYKNPNDYKALVLSELRKGVMHFLEDKLIYGNSSTNPKEFDGLHALAAAGCALDIDEGGPLSLANLRAAIDAVKPKPDLILMPFELQRRMDAAMFEAGITAGAIIRVATDVRGIGERLTYFEGIPILPTDFIVAEQEGSPGTKYSSGTKVYPVFVLRFGQLTQGGLCMAIGGETGGPDFFQVTQLDVLEDYDAGGIRLVAYCALALGSTKALARIYDITDAAITA